MNMRFAQILPLLAALMLLAAGLAPRADAAGMGPRRSTMAAPTEDPNGARAIVRYKAMSGILSAQGGAMRQGPMKAALMGQRTGLVLRDGHLLDGRTEVVHGDKRLSSAELAARLAADPEVEAAWPDLRRHVLATVPNDPLYPTFVNGALNPLTSPDYAQWYLEAPDSSALTPTATSNISGINAQAAWNITTGSASVVIADIDTGVRFDHPDLTNKLIYPGRSFYSSDGSATGWSADASDPGDYTTAGQCGNGQPTTNENSSWHGTQVMGLLGAETDNGIGIASIGRNVTLLPVRALGPCGGYDSDIIAAMLWAAGIPLPSNDPNVPNPGGVPVNPHPARVINLSLGSDGTCGPTATSPGTVYYTYIPQIVAAGVTVVAAAGNGVENADYTGGGIAVTVPANCPGVIAVAASRNIGTKVGFSNLGPEVAISAPGGNCINATGPCLFPMVTTTNPGATVPVATSSIPLAQQTAELYTNSSNWSVGTSFAAPLVAGTAGLMLSAAPTLTPAQVKALLQSSARAFPTTSAGATTPVPTCTAPPAYPASSPYQDECICTTGTCGAGLLDAGRAVAAAVNAIPPTVVLTPSATTVAAGGSVSFDGGGSSAAGGRTIANYAWTLTSGAGLASITTSPAAGAGVSAVTVATHAAGSFSIQLTVTDSAGNSATQSSTVTVTGSAGGSGAGGGGGGAMSFAWLAALALALLALARTPRRGA
ncbi:MAG: S8 family serine peptidase [Burkholderiales bacterium]|nr:S8 family serine peptidase [Burkholderiales bacterium]